MPHPLVTQLHFARSELMRCVEGVTEEEAARRFETMNCISWMVGHVANQEQTYWLLLTGRELPYPDLYKLVGTGKPASTPSLAEMRKVWRSVTAAADEYLQTLTTESLQTHILWKGEPRPENIGTMLQRCIYHYWFHLGEAFAVRQLLGHTDLPEFVGDMSGAAYQPE